MDIINFSNIVEANGKTIRQNNLERKHKYPIGTIVKFEVNESHEDNIFVKGTVQAYVCRQTRDCDGSPLYTMSLWNPDIWSDIHPSLTPEDYDETLKNLSSFSQRRQIYEFLFKIWFNNYGEESLTEVK